MPAHRIVAIDYDAQIGERLRAAFAPPEFDFRWFAGGIEALAALQGLQPDVIICDVMLPDIDGRAVLDAVKRSPALRDVPFLVLSGARSEATMRATLDAGADAFLLKPFPVSQLVQTIRKVLRDMQTDAGAPIDEVQRSPATSPGLSAVGRPGRDGASGPTAARTLAREAAGRQRIGFETRDPVLEAPRPEPPVVPTTSGEALPSREDVSPHAAPPIRLEGRISSLELDGARIRIVTEAEKGRTLLVRTTVARDGKELRRVETTLDRSLESGEDERSLKELIDLQHAGALQKISRLPMPAPRRQEEPPRADEPEERMAPQTPPAAHGSANAEPAGERAAPPASLPVKRKSARRSTKAAGRSRKAPGPSNTVEAKPRASGPAYQQPPISVDTVVLKPAVEAEPVVPERDTIPEPELPRSIAPAARQTDSTLKRPWLVGAVAAVAIAAGFLLEDPSAAPPAAKTPEPGLKSASSPDASSAAPTPPIAQSHPAGDVRQTAPVRRPSKAWLERSVRGRREWAQALYEAGRYEEAKAALGEVFKLAPSDPEARQLAAQIQRTPRAVAAPGSNDAARPSERRPIENSPTAAEASRAGDRAEVDTQAGAAGNAQAVTPETLARPQAEEPRRAERESAQPQTPRTASPDPVVEPGAMMSLDDPGIVAPIAERKPPLAYPQMAMRQRVEGTVQLRALVDENGAVADAHVVSGLTREDLNQAAVAYVKKWTFRPARKNGVPVKVWLPVRIDFRLPL